MKNNKHKKKNTRFMWFGRPTSAYFKEHEYEIHYEKRDQIQEYKITKFLSHLTPSLSSPWFTSIQHPLLSNLWEIIYSAIEKL